MIEVQNLAKVYTSPADGRSLVALRDASFTAERGRVFGLLGANGAGKTTTLRILSTVLKPSAGSARIAGHSVVDEPDKARAKIGFLSGSTGVYDRMTPVELLQYFGRLYGMSAAQIKARSEQLIEWLDMKSFCDRHCGTLSTGQKQKASIARALIHDPEVLIFDEPTSGLDILVARAVVEFVASLKTKDRCILISTHIMSEVEALCDDVAILHHGEIRASGTLNELKERFETDSIGDVFFKLIKDSDGGSKTGAKADAKTAESEANEA